MGESSKRKRSLNAEDDLSQPPSKTLVVASEAAKTSDPKSVIQSGESRQLKSERRKKKAVQAKQSTQSKKVQTNNDNEIREKVNKDDIASGTDLVSLGSAGTQMKEKRRSPRSIRKEARQKKTGEGIVKKAAVKAEQLDVGTSNRFICFVGNLPYSVTTEQIATHFSKLQPKSIRLSTDKTTGKCKGFAFLEFENFDKMKTCLKLYHHSIFDPEPEDQNEGNKSSQNAKSKGRKINVELTAGGGGKSSSRKDKITKKNKKLDEERARGWEKNKTEGGRNQSKSFKSAKGAESLSGPNAEQIVDSDRGDIHPSRLGRVKG